MSTTVNSTDFSFSNPRTLLIPARVKMMLSMGGGSVIGGLVFAAFWFGLPAITPAADAMARATQVMTMTSGIGFLLFLSVCTCFRLFDTQDAMNPLKGGESLRHQTSTRVLSNSVEQALIFVLPFIALGFAADEAIFRILPAALGTWLVARLFFFASYHFNPALRSVGMVPTLMASCILYGALGYHLCG